tara:strand:- start:442 stop:696 length:255 start_codon:yes stop_codon:yes gene_type:complete
MIQRVEITQELIRKTKVDFWNELMVGDVLEFSRETIKRDTTVVVNLRTNEYAPDNKWTPYLRDEAKDFLSDDKRAVFKLLKAYR